MWIEYGNNKASVETVSWEKKRNWDNAVEYWNAIIWLFRFGTLFTHLIKLYKRNIYLLVSNFDRNIDNVWMSFVVHTQVVFIRINTQSQASLHKSNQQEDAISCGGFFSPLFKIVNSPHNMLLHLRISHM